MAQSAKDPKLGTVSNLLKLNSPRVSILRTAPISHDPLEGVEQIDNTCPSCWYLCPSLSELAPCIKHFSIFSRRYYWILIFLANSSRSLGSSSTISDFTRLGLSTGQDSAIDCYLTFILLISRRLSILFLFKSNLLTLETAR